MLSKIKELADEAVKLQNKNRMDEVLREIIAMCTQVAETPVKKEDAAPASTTKVAKSAKGVKADE